MKWKELKLRLKGIGDEIGDYRDPNAEVPEDDKLVDGVFELAWKLDPGNYDRNLC